MSEHKAQYWKCALQVNPASYIKYRGEQQNQSEDEYNQAILAACLEESIKIIGCADHGNVAEIASLKNVLEPHGIVVFPGFEIASSEKIHFVCLFDECKTSTELNRILGSLELIDPTDGVSPSRLGAIQLIDKVTELGGFIYAAHSTNDDGVLKRRMHHVWQYSGLLAAQIPGSIEDLKGVEDDFYRKAIQNKLPDYRKTPKIAVINAADVAKPGDLRKPGASCFIKMTTPTFSAFKMAFVDPESRVRLHSDMPENHASAIERIEFIDGYLDGVDISISEHLNTIIGGRGTGKSTLLECIRYALDKKPFEAGSADKQHKKIVDQNLGKDKGMVKLTIRSNVLNGRRFTVSRKYGEYPVVRDEQNQVTQFHPSELVPDLEIYGQNEIYEMVRDDVQRTVLIKRFISDEKPNEMAQRLQTHIADNRKKILDQQKEIATVETEVEQLPNLQERAKLFADLGLEEKLKIIPVLEREKHLIQTTRDEVLRFSSLIEIINDNLPEPVFLSEAAISTLPRAEDFRKLRSAIEDLKNAGIAISKQLQESSTTAMNTCTPITDSVAAQVKAQEDELEKAFRKIPANNGKSGKALGAEYKSILTRIEQIKPKQQQLATRNTLLTELYRNRATLLADLREERTRHASDLKRKIKTLNRKLENKVKLELCSEAQRQDIVEYLLGCRLEQVGAARLSWVIENDFTPAHLATKIREGHDALVNCGWGITPTVATSLCKMTEQQLLMLEEVQVSDRMSIELNVSHTDEAQFRDVDSLSTGQQCTAILHLLLLDNNDPLILDQPEDNLDNAFIADRIVTQLRIAKTSRQFIFATHNANIPVFGDAEWIGVISSDSDKGVMPESQQGAIDVEQIQKLAADILEGGEVAFNQRRKKYGFDDKAVTNK